MKRNYFLVLVAWLLSSPAHGALIQHLDATVTASVTTNGSGIVSQWADQSGAGNNAVAKSGIVYYPSTSLLASGIRGMDFSTPGGNALELFSAANSGSWLNFNGGATNNTGFAALLAFKVNGGIGTDTIDVFGNSTAVKSGLTLRVLSSGSPRAWLGGADMTKSAAIVNGDTLVCAVNYTASNGLFEFWDSKSGSSMTANVARTDFSLANDVTLGKTTAAGRYLTGVVGEVKVFDHALNATDFASEYSVLVAKWITSAIADTNPPTPNPATWASAPSALGPSSITMTATTGSDPSGVQYFFHETTGNPGGTDSGWQSSPTYTNSGLSALTQYGYTVMMRDGVGNTGAVSTVSYATTLEPDSLPPTPNPATWASAPAALGPYSITMTATTGSDPSGVQYFFHETTGNPGGADSGWQSSPTYTDSGLSPLTQYGYTVMMRDLLGNTGLVSSVAYANTPTNINNRPNIVMLYIDDWAWNGTPIRMDDRMANSALSLVKMPNLESLRAQGMLFRNAYGSVMCVPARACLQTGQSSARHQMTVELGRTTYYDTISDYAQFPVIPNGVQQGLLPTLVTIPKALAPLGYKCAHFGKWHLTSDPADAGYDVSDGATDNNEGQTIINNDLSTTSDPKRMGEVTTNAMAFMEQQVGLGNPFYVQLSHYAMHEGRECFPATRAKYQNIPSIVAYNGGKTDPNTIGRKSDPAVWLGMAEELDGKIGQLLQKITDLGIATNTYVIMASDNGYREDFFDEISGLAQPLHGAKWWGWQAGIRVAMIVKGPGIPTNSLCTANVVNYDLLPTFVDWAGGNPASLHNVDGTSLAGLFRGEPQSDAFLNRSLYFHYPHYRTSMPHSTIVKGRYKVVYFYETPVRFPGWNPIMLFDLASDGGEYRNIYDQNPALAQSLYADLTNQLATAGARMPLVPNTNYNPAVYAAAAEYPIRVQWGPFIGTRAPESDESPQIQSYADYWLASWGVNLGAMTNDYDGDGVANFTEYALGGNPTNALDKGIVPTLGRSGDSLNYVYALRKDDPSLTYTMQATTNLASGIWTAVGTGVSGYSAGADSLGFVTNTVDMGDPRRFFRLRVESP